MKNMHKLWTDDEVQFLMEAWAECVPTKEVAEVLGRTKRSCDQKIKREKEGYRVRRILVPED